MSAIKHATAEATPVALIQNPDAYPVSFVELPESKGGGYAAAFPDLPGCFGHGRTRVEALESGVKNMEIWAKACADRRIPIPQPGEHRRGRAGFRIRVPRSMHKRVANLADLEGVSNNALVAAILKQGLTSLSPAGGGVLYHEMKNNTVFVWKCLAQNKKDFSWEHNDHDNYSGEWVQRIEPKLHHELRHRAEEQGVSMNTLAVALLSYGIGFREGLMELNEEGQNRINNTCPNIKYSAQKKEAA